ncbi:pfkB family kinase [Rhizodiscina lignyota]|uniref:PfkB family kinase n=1 Tax=Rhizodiscina lignyota TaxID=1504668 RepID=A0A9P4M3B0_9PEZI|nr:pfkB family kinase [Rhizodiscina lignyota]
MDESSIRGSSDRVLFVSLGMVVLDELRFPSSPPAKDVVGGSGAYSTLGARIAAGSSGCRNIGCLVLAGNDFPQHVEEELRNWDMTIVIRKDPDKLSTRGLLQYEDDAFGPKTFKYLTQPLKPTPEYLKSTPLLRSHAFHMLAKPEEMLVQVPELFTLRLDGGVQDHPLIIWEPFPASCRPENLSAALRACELVDVFSPNHLQLAAFFSSGCDSHAFSQDRIQEQTLTFLNTRRQAEWHGCVAVRAGEHGCFIASNGSFRWLPPFYGPKEDLAKVKDPTGAGNAFLGGFSIGFINTGESLQAAKYGTVAASFALEQTSLPQRTVDAAGEKWNDSIFEERLQELNSRLQVTS